MHWKPPITPERGKFYIGSSLLQRDPKYHIWEVVEGNLGEGILRSMCGLKMERRRMILNRGMWGRLKKYESRLCKRCPWKDAQAAALLGGMDDAETPEEHAFMSHVLE
jgi:hypothetical protein